MEENAALQARIEALKSGPAQAQPYVPPARQAGGNAAPYADSGELAVDSKDPKAAVMSLKEAIEAMNDASGVYDKEHAK
jgi:hypothetical protein